MAKRAGSSSSRVGVDETSDPGPSEYEMAYQNYVASSYARGMYEKRYRDMAEAAVEELSELLVATREEMIAAMRKKSRVRRVLGGLQIVDASNEAGSIASPALEAFDKGVEELGHMTRSLEETLNQLPIKNGILFSENDAVKLNSAAELLANNLEVCLSGLEGVQESWEKYAAIVQDMSDEDLSLRKNRCDDLMRRINDATLKLSSLRAAKTALQTLNS